MTVLPPPVFSRAPTDVELFCLRPMRITSRSKAIVFFVVLGVCLVMLAIALNVSWIILNWRQEVMLFLGVILFAVLFFFQAEDGIRYLIVTGVQTCALPI